MKTIRDPNSPAYYPEDHSWLYNKLRTLNSKIKKFWKKRILRYTVCSWKGCNFDDSEWGYMIGSETHDQWCSCCDKFRGIPCAEHPKYDNDKDNY